MTERELYADHSLLLTPEAEGQRWLTASDQEFGKMGERFTREWLEGQGYRFCAERYKPGPLAEVDLILQPEDDPSRYLFLEVKSRRHLDLNDPLSYEGLIHPRQRARLIQLGGAFAERHDCSVELILAFLTLDPDEDSLRLRWRLMPLL